MDYLKLSHEQQVFVNESVSGKNVLVDACIGSGKTTAIQALCDMMPGRRILYMTYNALLKFDAQAKIRNYNTYPTNYHSFAMRELGRHGIQTSMKDAIKTYNRLKPALTEHYDTLIIDEYQDLQTEFSVLLNHVNDSLPYLQKIAVGDMQQKIYDFTTLHADEFMQQFLQDPLLLEFTQCFRLNVSHAEMLGRIWDKKIIGVNQNCVVRTMSKKDLYDHILQFEPKDLLVLGGNTSRGRNDLLNYLEGEHHSRFNEFTVWSKSRNDQKTKPSPENAIFTTFDGCKGMERRICVVFDWTPDYWESRLGKDGADIDILRNIFCVAASRGKQEIIFVKPRGPKARILTEDDIVNSVSSANECKHYYISDMFGFKYHEDIVRTYQTLNIKEIEPEGSVLPVALNYGTIDLQRCIYYSVMAEYFVNYDLNAAIINLLQRPDRAHMVKDYEKWSTHQKVLYLVQLETMQNRYFKSVPRTLLTQEAVRLIGERLSKYLPRDADMQYPTHLDFCGKDNNNNDIITLFEIDGRVDIVLNNIPWMVLFTDAISQTDCLQMASHLAARDFLSGRILNVMTGEVVEVSLKNRQKFLENTARTITKGRVCSYFNTDRAEFDKFMDCHEDACIAFYKRYKTKKPKDKAYVCRFFKKYNAYVPISGDKFEKFMFE